MRRWTCSICIEPGVFDERLKGDLAWAEDLCRGIEQWLKSLNSEVDVSWDIYRECTHYGFVRDLVFIHLRTEKLDVLKWAFEKVADICEEVVCVFEEIYPFPFSLLNVKWDELKREIREAVGEMRKYNGKIGSILEWFSRSRAICLKVEAFDVSGV